MEDKTDLVLTDTLKRLTIGQSRHRHYGKSSGIMLMKNAMDIKKQLTGNPEGLVLNVKRAAFWNDQPVCKSFVPTPYPDQLKLKSGKKLSMKTPMCLRTYSQRTT